MADELHVAVEATRSAGEILRSRFCQTHDIQYKGPTDIVTEADRTAEAHIVELLRAATLEYGFLTEESPSIDGSRNSCWIVDPLDGTVNYALGHPHFCISIALESEELLEIGVIYDPIREEVFVAQRSKGATLNGRPIYVNEADSLSRAVVSTGFPYDAWTTDWDNSAEVAYFVKRARGLRSTGYATLDLATVTCGRQDAHWECGLSAYDVAAGILLVREAGGVVTDYNGRANALFASEIVAANLGLHREMLAYLRMRHRTCQA